MAQRYVHLEIETAQSSKKSGQPCGDVVACDRNVAGTTLVCADGIGSGAHAHLAAEMCVSRLLELLRLDFSLRKAVASIVRTMEKSRDPLLPFAAFSVARIRADGMATVLGYESPGPILISRRHASELQQNPVELGGALVQESNCFLEPKDALLLMSDGITQAGLGGMLPHGWQTEGVARFLNDGLTNQVAPKDLPAKVHHEARRLWTVGGDDCTVALALCRQGQIVNILTGPPKNREEDTAVARRFLKSEGLKIVCGGTTAEIVARALHRPMQIESEPKSMIAPPRYTIEGVDLVTEGAVTLNQVYNLLDEDLNDLKEDSGVTDLCALLQIADRVSIHLGSARNTANSDISFRQCGILSRDQIIPLIAEKLRTAGKLVTVQQY
jgi:hypothetical protein